MQHHPQPQNIWVQARRTAATVFWWGAERGWTSVTIHGLRPHTKRTSKCRLWWHVHAVAFAVVLWKTSNTWQCHCSVPRFKMPIIFRNKSKTICLKMCLFAKKYRMALKVKLFFWGKTSILGHVKHKSGLPTQSLQSLHRLDADFGSP